MCERCDEFVARKHVEGWQRRLRVALKGHLKVSLPGETPQQRRDSRGRFA